jgi:hypothetical protein
MSSPTWGNHDQALFGKQSVRPMNSTGRHVVLLSKIPNSRKLLTTIPLASLESTP